MNIYDSFIEPLFNMLPKIYNLLGGILFYEIPFLDNIKVIELLGYIGAGAIVLILIVRVIRG